MTFGIYYRKRTPPTSTGPIETNVQLNTNQQIPRSIAVRTLSSDTKIKLKNKNFTTCTKDEQNGKIKFLLKTPKTNSKETSCLNKQT